MSSDDQSGLQSVSLSLGRTEHDIAILGWTGVGTSGNGTVMVDIPNGVDTWVKLRATNNGEMYLVRCLLSMCICYARTMHM